MRLVILIILLIQRYNLLKALNNFFTSRRSIHLSMSLLQMERITNKHLKLDGILSEIKESTTTTVKKLRRRFTLNDIIELLCIYKELYNNLDIPVSFKIPLNDSRWPSDSWNLSLGHKVVDIRRGKSFSTPEAVTELSNIGFNWTINENTYDHRNALQTVRSFNKVTNRKIGMVSNMTNQSNQESIHSSVVDLLKIYKAEHGDVNVPQHWLVPENDSKWPSEYWNYRLGLQVSKIRAKYSKGLLEDHLINQLEALNFIYNVRDYKFTLFSDALQIYLKIYGDTIIPVKYVVECATSDLWPNYLDHYNLGFIWHRYKLGYVFSSPIYQSMLNDLFSDQCIPFSNIAKQINAKILQKQINFSAKEIEIILESLDSYRCNYPSHRQIPYLFRVPYANESNSDIWPLLARGLQLGKMYSRLQNLRYNTTVFSENIVLYKKLEDLEFQDKINQDNLFNLVVKCVVAYKECYGHLNIPYAFKVPATPSYPSSMHGKYLGKIISKYKHHPKELDENEWKTLKSIGIILKPVRDQNFDKIVKALMVHYQLYGDYLVPRYFVVPSEEPWPQQCWGLQLGIRVRNIRHNRAYCSMIYYKALEKIGFPMESIIR